MADWRELLLGIGRGAQQGGNMFAQLYPQAKMGQYNAAVDNQRYQGDLARQMQSRQDMLDERDYRHGQDTLRQQGDTNNQAYERIRSMLEREDAQRRHNELLSKGEKAFRPNTTDEAILNDPSYGSLKDKLDAIVNFKKRLGTESSTGTTGKIDQLNAGIENPVFGQLYNDYMESRNTYKTRYENDVLPDFIFPDSVGVDTLKPPITPATRDSAANFALTGLNRLRGQNAQMQGFNFGQQKQPTDTTTAGFDPSKLSDEELQRIINGGQ